VNRQDKTSETVGTLPKGGMAEMTKVLVVDDNQPARAVLAMALSDMGLAVSEATSGEEALAKARVEIPDLILLDVEMPGMDGFEVLRKLKESPVTRSTPVVMSTGFQVVEGEARAMELGSIHYLTKPWSLDILEATVRVAIREGLDREEQEDEESNVKDQVIKTGGKLSILEAKMDGGVPLNTVTLIEGAPTTGKSVLCQHLTFGALAEGHDTAYFTSEHTPEGLVAQMESIGLDVSENRPDKLQIYRLPERAAGDSSKALLSLVQCFRRLPPECDFIVGDAITALAASCPEGAVIEFFTSCRRLCAQGITVVLSVDSYAFSSEMFIRLGTLCDSYLRLRSEKVKEKALRTLEVCKINTTDLSRDNMISFVVEPSVGIHIIPYSKTRA